MIIAKSHKFLLFVSLITFSCQQPTKEKVNSNIQTDSSDKVQIDTVDGIVSIQETTDEFLKPSEIVFEDYKFKAYYTDYNEDKYGNSNPGFIEIYKNNSLVFKDSILGYDKLEVEVIGYKNLSGRKLFFKIDNGLAACDYIQNSLIYFISSNDHVVYLDNFSSMFTDYAGSSTKAIFPEDSNGVQNKIIKIHYIKYHEGQEPNKSDTTIFEFNGMTFKKKIIETAKP